jgi:hypothetical protein
VALVIETGVGISGANSYVSLAEVRSYCADRGLTLPSSDATLEGLVIRAMDYVESHYNLFKGSKIFGEGYVQWPRENVVIDNFEVPITTIPTILKNVQCQVAYDLQSVDPTPNVTSFPLRREKVDTLEKEYAVAYNKTTYTPLPRLTKAEGMIRPLLKQSGLLFVTRA